VSKDITNTVSEENEEKTEEVDIIKEEVVSEESPEAEEADEATAPTGEEEARQPLKGKKLADSPMANILAHTAIPPQDGDLVEGPVISIEKSAVFIDLAPYGTGIIYGRELLNTRDVIKKLNIGDDIAAKVVEAENEDGYIELSLKEARQALVWSEAEDLIKQKTVLELPVTEANKGGLIIEWKGIPGFLPASQLKTEHYPRVEDGDKNKILEELKKLVDRKIAVSILSISPKEGKLIFSEKRPEMKEKEKMIGKYEVGNEVEGEVTGMVDFGVFVKIESGLEGLVHISEIDWSLVEDPKTLFRVGDKVKVKIIEIKEGKISLSIKALKDNPWNTAESKYKKGDKVEGVIIKYNKHGALASIEEGIAGLVHISEFNDEKELREKLELGKTYQFRITLFEPKNQKMALTFQNANSESETPEKE
jgi:small subunit ribosomal protein S1